ncbi:MAG: hypothetical protein KC502_23275 [Myxococcales bacterium]|nr:hypothetical protein [Myxococcales bacterium]
MTRATFVARPHAAHAYGVLAHLDIGQDAASIYDASLPQPPWAEGLVRAWHHAPGRLALQFAPLLANSEAELLGLLRGTGLAPLQDEAGQVLRQTFAAALRTHVSTPTPATDDGHQSHTTSPHLPPATRTQLAADLHTLRTALWAIAQCQPPALEVWHVPALRGHGRAVSQQGRRVCATSLDAPSDEVLCQILHEECHAVSDPVVHEELGVCAPRNTAVGTPGHEVHRALERAAVTLGALVIAEAMPRLMPAYAAWRARFGV